MVVNNLTQVSGTPDFTVPGFAGTAFDGRYVYFAPTSVGQLSGNDVQSGKATRFDSQADFTKAASWWYFDLTSVSPYAAGFAGAVFDGRYLYFAPGSQTHALARATTPRRFCHRRLVANLRNHERESIRRQGAVFDGRYIYFVPGSGGVTYRAVIARYDTQASLTSATAWATYDTNALNSDDFDAWQFNGGVFDGRYVYFIPRQDMPIVRVDTKADFSSNDAWSSVSSFRIASQSNGFSGGAFDGL